MHSARQNARKRSPFLFLLNEGEKNCCQTEVLCIHSAFIFFPFRVLSCTSLLALLLATSSLLLVVHSCLHFVSRSPSLSLPSHPLPLIPTGYNWLQPKWWYNTIHCFSLVRLPNKVCTKYYYSVLPPSVTLPLSVAGCFRYTHVHSSLGPRTCSLPWCCRVSRRVIVFHFFYWALMLVVLLLIVLLID